MIRYVVLVLVTVMASVGLYTHQCELILYAIFLLFLREEKGA